MKITQEDFDKLKQLDRIEYRQKEDKIDKWNDSSNGISFGYCLVAVIVFTVLLLPQLALLEILVEAPGLVIKILNTISILSLIFSVLMVFGFLLDIIFLIKRNHMREELQEEYFDFKTEVKK